MPVALAFLALVLATDASAAPDLIFANGFEPGPNLVFVTSTTHAANLGSASAYDAVCNTRATAAGINNPSNSAYVAWMSDAASLARNRLGSARGFVRIDGAPFTDRLLDLTIGMVFNAITIDEFGNDPGPVFVWTGTLPGGSVASTTCANWTSNSGLGAGGKSTGGSFAWTAFSMFSCSTPQHLYCFQRDKIATVAPSAPPSGAKTAFVTAANFVPGVGQGIAGADNLCRSEATSAGLPNPSSYRAMLAANGSSAASRFVVGSSTYVRPDGVVIGTATVLFGSGTTLPSGIWQTAAGSYISLSSSWTGSSAPNTAGTVSSTCNSWTDGATATIGLANVTDLSRWNLATAQPCSSPAQLYCGEQ